jgi:Tfp pilus assembly protein PilW
MNTSREQGFSLIELLVAATVFMFIVTGVSGLFIQALDIQRRASGIQKIEENSQFVMESIAREARVSTITSGNAPCASGTAPGPQNWTLTLEHPVNGTVVYTYDRASDIGVITRNAAGTGAQPITSSDVDITSFAFCVSGTGADGAQTSITIPMTLQTVGGRAATRVSVSLQTAVISRDLSTDLLP